MVCKIMNPITEFIKISWSYWNKRILEFMSKNQNFSNCCIQIQDEGLFSFTAFLLFAWIIRRIVLDYISKPTTLGHLKSQLLKRKHIFTSELSALK